MVFFMASARGLPVDEEDWLLLGTTVAVGPTSF